MMVGTVYASIGRVKESRSREIFTSSTTGASAEYGQVDIGILMVIANFLAVHFFAMLRDEGSWLDIGSSISHYVIAMSIGLASILLSLLGRWMLNSHGWWLCCIPGRKTQRYTKCSTEQRPELPKLR